MCAVPTRTHPYPPTHTDNTSVLLHMDARSLVICWSYLIGSVLFLLGSVLFHPHFSLHENLYVVAVVAFIAGSALFLVAAIVELDVHLNSLRSLYTYIPLGDKETDGEANHSATTTASEEFGVPQLHKSLDLSVSIIRSTLGVGTGTLFVVGSIAFLPTYLPQHGALVGNWLYRMGSVTTMCSTAWQILRLLIKRHKRKAESGVSTMLLVLLCSWLGALTFLIGGLFFLRGGAVEGSYIWSVGSCSFILSSLLAFFL